METAAEELQIIQGSFQHQQEDDGEMHHDLQHIIAPPPQPEPAYQHLRHLPGESYLNFPTTRIIIPEQSISADEGGELHHHELLPSFVSPPSPDANNNDNNNNNATVGGAPLATPPLLIAQPYPTITATGVPEATITGPPLVLPESYYQHHQQPLHFTHTQQPPQHTLQPQQQLPTQQPPPPPMMEYPQLAAAAVVNSWTANYFAALSHQHPSQVVVPQLQPPSSSVIQPQHSIQPTFVNAKQFKRILKRREARAKMEQYFSQRRAAATRGGDDGGGFKDQQLEVEVVVDVVGTTTTKPQDGSEPNHTILHSHNSHDVLVAPPPATTTAGTSGMTHVGTSMIPPQSSQLPTCSHDGTTATPAATTTATVATTVSAGGGTTVGFPSPSLQVNTGGCGRKPYLHESRHRHAMKRPRGPGGRFLKKEELAEFYRQNPDQDPANHHHEPHLLHNAVASTSSVEDSVDGRSLFNDSSKRSRTDSHQSESNNYIDHNYQP